MALIQIGISVCNFQSVTQKQALTMAEPGRILEYSEGDLEIQERLNEINVDQRLLTTWHRLAQVYKLENFNENALDQWIIFREGVLGTCWGVEDSEFLQVY